MRATARVSLIGLAAAAIGAFTAPPSNAGKETTGGFGEVMGMYVVDSGLDDWRLFGPGLGGNSTTKVGLGEGAVGRVMLGYRMGIWDAAVAGQFGSMDNGDESVGAGVDGRIKAEYFALDAMLGYNTRLGAATTRWALGVRFADWDNTASTTSLQTINHDWKGFGPRGEFQAKVPLSGALNLQVGGGVSYLLGDIKTSASPGWNCTQCSNYDANSWNVDGSIGVGWQFAPSGTLVLGYRAEYWSDVNVQITDNSGFGENRGTSGHLIHGPFVSLKVGIGN